MPEVSIVVPAYNRADLISETLDSVLNQDYADWECLIVDDHSTDSTAEVCAKYVARDSRFKFYLNQRSKGAQGARNTGIDEATGKYVIFLDSDDLLSTDCLSRRLAAAQQNPGYDFYCFPTGVFKRKPFDSGVLWNYVDTPDDDLIRFLRQDMPWHTTGVLWKKEVLVALDGWDEAVYSWQDWDIHLRALLDKKITYWKSANDAVDSFYRKDASSNAISIRGYTSNSIKARMYLLDKFFGLLPLKSETVNFEFAKLIYRESVQIYQHYDKKVALQFLKEHLLRLGYSKVFSQSWCLYLDLKNDKSYHKVFKKLVGIIPIIYKSKPMLSNKRSHLNAPLKASVPA